MSVMVHFTFVAVLFLIMLIAINTNLMKEYPLSTFIMVIISAVAGYSFAEVYKALQLISGG